MTVKVVSAEYIGSYSDIEKLPKLNLPEIAIVGRSNVGKSSFLNRVTGRKKLARTSNTPGQTRQLNFFRVKMSLDGQAYELALVDLPGFGFAKLSKAEREKIAAWTVLYLTSGRPIQSIWLLNNCRRLPQIDERAIQDIGFKNGLKLQIVLTKADKLGKNELYKMITKIAEAYSIAAEELLVTGVGLPIEELWRDSMKTISDRES